MAELGSRWNRETIKASEESNSALRGRQFTETHYAASPAKGAACGAPKPPDEPLVTSSTLRLVSCADCLAHETMRLKAAIVREEERERCAAKAFASVMAIEEALYTTYSPLQKAAMVAADIRAVSAAPGEQNNQE